MEIQDETRASGLLTLANTTGAMMGSLLSGVFLIPYLGVERSFFFLGVMYGLAGMLSAGRRIFSPWKRRKVIPFCVPGVLIICMGGFPFGRMASDYLERPWAPLKSGGEKRVALKEGMSETIQYLRKDLLGKPYYHRLVTNNYSMSCSNKAGRRYIKLFAY